MCVIKENKEREGKGGNDEDGVKEIKGCYVNINCNDTNVH